MRYSLGMNLFEYLNRKATARVERGADYAMGVLDFEAGVEIDPLALTSYSPAYLDGYRDAFVKGFN